MNHTKIALAVKVTAAKTMTSIEIAELTEKKHGHIIRDIKSMMTSINPNMDALDYKGVFVERREDNGQIKAIHLPKDLTITLVSGYNVVMRHRIVTRWQELEAKKAPVELTRMDLIRLAMEAEQERLLLAAQVEEMQPAVAALERLAEADGTFNVREAAKQLNLKPSQLTTWMGANNWIYKQGAKSPWMAYQPRLDAGLMMHKTTAVEGADGITTIRSQARITAKGLTTISKQIEKANRTAKILSA